MRHSKPLERRQIKNRSFTRGRWFGQKHLAKALDDSSVDKISIEDAHRHNDLVLLERFSNSTVILGCVAIAASRVESVDTLQMAVLSPQCRVRGVENLRVVDSSVFPVITNGNLNAPTIMAAEKMTDLIRSRRPLTEIAPYWIDEHWRLCQRIGAPARDGAGA